MAALQFGTLWATKYVYSCRPIVETSLKKELRPVQDGAESAGSCLGSLHLGKSEIPATAAIATMCGN
jgi:hypothetical protein